MNLKLLLEIRKRGLKQNQLSLRAGIPETVLSKIITGRRKPYARERAAIAEALQLPTARIFPCETGRKEK